MSQLHDRPNTNRARNARPPSATLHSGSGRSAPYTYTYKAREGDRTKLRFETDATLDGFVAAPRTRARPRPSASTRRTTYEIPVVAEDVSERVRRPNRRWGLNPFTRLRLIMAIIVGIALILGWRLYTLQVQQGSWLVTKGDDQRIHTTIIDAMRGQIRDANDRLLATSIPIYRFYASPCGLSKATNANTVTKISALLPATSVTGITAAFDTTACPPQGLYNLIAANVSSDTADKIMALQLAGVYREAYAERSYPNGTMASQILGFANAEGAGAYGVEGQYNDILSGTAAKLSVARDRSQNPIPDDVQKLIETAPVDGKDVNLTLDTNVQYIVEQELKKGIADHKADSGMAMVMDPRTGAILAAAAFPNFDPNTYGTTDPKLFKNPLVNDIYEPGSTFKILTAAMGIDSGAVTPDSWADLPGCVVKAGWPICNYNSVGYTHQTVVDTLIHSSNVGAMWIADHLKPQTYYDYLKKFGIGSQTGVDLSGEAEGLVSWPTRTGWAPLDMDMSAFGQNTAVSPLQLVAAVSAVANGTGVYMKPYIVQSITKDGVIYYQHQPDAVRQVISAQSAKTVANMLIPAVECGEARFAHVDGYHISGKTGTAQIVTNGAYEPQVAGHTRGSTIAWPTDDPRFIVLVRLDRTKDTIFGSNTAAPVVHNITAQLLNYYQMPPTPGVDGCKYHH